MTRDPSLEPLLKLPPSEVGAALAVVAESQWFDRKSIRIRPAQLAQTEVALANAEGGTIVIGIHDGSVEGTDGQPQRRNELMQAAIDQTEPPVRARSTLIECRNRRGDVDHLLVVDIQPSETVHA